MNSRDHFTIMFAENRKDISSELLLPNGKLKLMNHAEWMKYPWMDFRTFCHIWARYGIPTLEMINHLQDIIGGRKALEIGAGYGDFGYHLGIPYTDSKVQMLPTVKAQYEAMGQPTIQYPPDVVTADALDAVKKYKPQVVIGSWITPYSSHEVEWGSSPYGIKENEILPLVETYILIGNLDTHGDRPLLKLPHQCIELPFNLSRAKNQSNNRLFIWNNKK